MISRVVARFEIYKKPSEASFTLKRSSSRAILGTQRPLSLKKNQKANQDAPKIRRDLDRAYIEMLHNAFDEGVQKKAKTILKGCLKEADHLGNGNNVRHEVIRTPDLDFGGRFITSSEGFSV